MLGFAPTAFLPLGQAVDDGLHGAESEVARELDQADAATTWMIEVDGVDTELDRALREREGRPDLWRRFLVPGAL